MKFVEKKIGTFIDEIDSNTPTPGGGTVSAFSSVLGCSLGRMVAHLTFNKKKYIDLDEENKDEFEKAFKELLEIKKVLESLMDQDSKVYDKVMEAYKLPKTTEEEKEIRENTIENRLLSAIEVPLNVCQKSKRGLELLYILLKNGNKNAITDIGVGALLLYSGVEGGGLNVKINLSSMKNKKLKNEIEKKLEIILKDSKEIKEKIMIKVNESI